jgi:hypothetical protein
MEEPELWRPCQGKWQGVEMSNLGRLRRLHPTTKYPAGYALVPHAGKGHGPRYNIPRASGLAKVLFLETWPEEPVPTFDHIWINNVRARNKKDNARLPVICFHKGQRCEKPAEPDVDDPDWFNMLGFKNLRVPDPAWGF